MKSYHVHKVPDTARLPARLGNNTLQPKGAEG